MKCEVIYVEKYDNNGPVFTVVDTFTCETHAEAAMRIEGYNKVHDDRTYYYRPENRYYLLNSDGTQTPAKLGDFTRDTVDNIMREFTAKMKKEWRGLRKDKNSNRRIKLVKKIGRIRKFMNIWIVKKTIASWLWLKDNLEWYCRDKWKYAINDWKNERKRVKYFKKYHHDTHESWSLDTHLLADLKWNLIRLKNESYGIPTKFIEEAMNEAHSSEPDWDFDKWYEKNQCNSEAEELAIKKMNEVYDRIINLIDLYGFYAITDIDDDNFPEKKDPAEPIILPGTYDILDYKKMHEKSVECYSQIWDLVKKYGPSMWD